nr:glycosyltransferase [Micromonospora sp. DSM 115978]
MSRAVPTSETPSDREADAVNTGTVDTDAVSVDAGSAEAVEAVVLLLSTSDTDLLSARASGADLEVAVTATRSEAAAAGLTEARRLRFVGRLSPVQLAEYQAACAVTVCPTRFESFGYPLAEARLAGQPVVALDLAHAREVAGPVLHAYRDGDVDGAADAVLASLKADCRPEQANPFDPDSYFEWLLDQ